MASEYNKFWVALIGLVGTILVQYFGSNQIVQDIMVALTAVGVYTVPNKLSGFRQDIR